MQFLLSKIRLVSYPALRRSPDRLFDGGRKTIGSFLPTELPFPDHRPIEHEKRPAGGAEIDNIRNGQTDDAQDGRPEPVHPSDGNEAMQDPPKHQRTVE